MWVFKCKSRVKFVIFDLVNFILFFPLDYILVSTSISAARFGLAAAQNSWRNAHRPVWEEFLHFKKITSIKLIRRVGQILIRFMIDMVEKLFSITINSIISHSITIIFSQYSDHWSWLKIFDSGKTPFNQNSSTNFLQNIISLCGTQVGLHQWFFKVVNRRNLFFNELITCAGVGNNCLEKFIIILCKYIFSRCYSFRVIATGNRYYLPAMTFWVQLFIIS